MREFSSGGAESDTYLRLNPPYLCKNAPFETVDELRLVYGAHLYILYGEDVNLNGVLDPNENDGDVSPPSDDQNGRLDPGILEYVTVYSHEPSTTTNGTARVNVGDLGNPAQASQLRALLQNAGVANPNLILARTTTPPAVTSVLEFYIRSGMSAEDFAKIEVAIRNPRPWVAPYISPTTMPTSAWPRPSRSPVSSSGTEEGSATVRNI